MVLKLNFFKNKINIKLDENILIGIFIKLLEYQLI